MIIFNNRRIYLIKTMINGLYRSLVILQTVLLGILLLIVTLQIATRVMPFLPNLLWTEEIARFLLIWVIFLGASIGVKESSHFTVSLLAEPKSKRIIFLWDLAILILMMGFSSVFAFRGLKYALVLLWDISDIAQISMLWVGISIPVFGFLSLIFLLELTFKIVRKGGH